MKKAKFQRWFFDDVSEFVKYGQVYFNLACESLKNLKTMREVEFLENWWIYDNDILTYFLRS